MSPLLALAVAAGWFMPAWGRSASTNPYADLGTKISKAEWARVVAEAARPPEGRTPLAVQRAAVERWAGVLAEFRKTSEAAPLAEVKGPEEGASVERLARLAAWAARVRFADGERTSATTLLLDVLGMGRRTASADAEDVAFGAFAAHLDDLPLAQCERVRAAVEGFLVARNDPRLCLLRLHMRVEAYRWRNLKPPEKPTDAAPAAEVQDPMMGRPFRYEAKGAGYRLWSERIGTLGDAASPSVIGQ